MNKWKIGIFMIIGSLNMTPIRAQVDYGDVPASYLYNHLEDDARHTISSTYLGNLIDAEEDSLTYQHFSEQAANKDDLHGVDDEDGVIGIDTAPLISGATNEYQKKLNLVVKASKSCKLSAWIDWNINNNWESSEKVISERVLQAGNNNIEIDIPTGDSNTTGQHNVVADSRNAGDKKSYARFRCTTDANIDYFGPANNGEVEDYELKIMALGLIMGQVYQDVNFNTIFDNGDINLDPVTVELLDSGDRVIQTTTTDANGTYRFEDVEMNDTPTGTTGFYKVRVRPNHEGVLSELCTLNDLITVKDATISEVSRVAKQNFGYVPYGEIGNYTWVDLNDNGVKEEGEPPLSGIKIVLNKDNQREEVITDENGYYRFKKLAPGGYTVISDNQTTPTGYSRTTNDRFIVTISPEIETALEVDPQLHKYRGRLMENANFGYKPTGVIGDFVWKDENVDQKQDYFEDGIEGVKVKLLDSDENEINSTTTDSSGNYRFTGVTPGNYIVEVDKSSTPLVGLKNSNTTTNRINVTLGEDSSQNLEADFGFYGDASIGHLVWKDLNQDQEKDEDEPGIPDVTITLYQDTNNNQKIDSGEPIINNTTTDTNGAYNFPNLQPDSYIVKVTDLNDKLASYIQTTASDRVNAPLHAVDGIRSGQSYNDANFGYKPPLGSIGDCIWEDTNNNQVKDNNEKGLKDVWVRLEGPDGISRQTPSQEDCSYSFGDLPAGRYSIDLRKAPRGYEYTTNKSQVINLEQGENNLNVDFGFYKELEVVAPPTLAPPPIIAPPTLAPPPIIAPPVIAPPPFVQKTASIGDCVWNDKNKNGKRDGGEDGLADIWIELTGGPNNSIKKQTSTRVDCRYSFDDLPNGKYRVEVVGPPYNYENSTPEVKFISLQGHPYNDADFGYYKPEEYRKVAPPEPQNLALSTIIPQTGYNPERAAEGFSAHSIFSEIDIKNPYYEYVLYLYVDELLEKENLKLTEKINLNDGLGMLIKGLELSHKKLLNNSDIKEFLKSKGILNRETEFILHEQSLNTPITYERAMLIIARLSHLVNDENKTTIGHWQQDYYQILNDRNLIPLAFRNNQNWQQELNRGEFFSFLYRTLQRKRSKTKKYIENFSISVPDQKVLNVPTRRTLLSHPDIWVDKLKKGAAFYEDISNDRLIVFAHSSNFPGELNPITKFFGNIFKPLIGSVQKDDLISIVVDNYKINYRVTEVERVSGNQIQALNKKDGNDLIVFTCDKDPRYRWIIRAKKSRH